MFEAAGVFILLGLLWGGGYSPLASIILAAIACIGVFALSFTRVFRGVLSRSKPLWIPATLFAIVITTVAAQLLAPNIRDREFPFRVLWRLLGLGACFLIGVSLAAQSGGLARLTRSVMTAGLAYGLIALGMVVVSPSVAMAEFDGRLTATLHSPNTLSAVMAITLLLATGSLAQRSHPLLRLRGGPQTVWLETLLKATYLEMGTIAVAVVVLGLTGSRSGLFLALTLATVAVVWEVLARRRKERLHRGLWWLMPIPALFVAASAGTAFFRLSVLGRDTVKRGEIYSAHQPFLFANPWLGQGYGDFSIINARLVTETNFAELGVIRDMHNVVLSWIEQAGWPGALVMFGLIGWVAIVIVHGSFRTIRGTAIMRAIFVIGLFLSLQGLLDIALEYQAVSAIWSLLQGAAFGAAVYPELIKRRRQGALA